MKRYYHINFKRIWIFIIALLVPCTLMAQIPEKINFQGFLTNTQGVAISDGLYDITFSIWDTDTPIAGHQLWKEILQVSVKNGIYNAYLGSDTPFNDPDKDGDTSDALTFAQPYYLGIQIKGDDNYITFEGKFLSLSSVGSAFRARTYSGRTIRVIDADYLISDADDIIFASGEIKITLPDASQNRGKEISIKKIDTQGLSISIITQNFQTIDNINRDTSNDGTPFIITTQYKDITLISDGDNWHLISNFSIDDIPEGAIAPEQLSDGIPYTKLVIDDNTISGSKIKDETISNNKLAGNVSADKLAGDIPADKLAGNIPSDKLSGDIPSDKLAGNIPSDKLSGDIPQDKLSGNIPYSKLFIENNEIPGNKITNMSIDQEKLIGKIGPEKLALTDGSISYTTLNLAGSIQSSDLAPDAVTFHASDLADGSIGSEKLAGDIGYNKLLIEDNEIPGNKIADMSIDPVKLNGKIGPDKLALPDGSIPYTTLNLAGSIQSSDLAPDAVTFHASDLADGSIGSEKLAGDIGYNKLLIEDNEIPGNKIADMSITSEKLSGNIGSDKLSLTDGSIPYVKLNMTNSIQSSDLAPDAVTFSASDLADNSVGQEKLAGSIGYDKLSIADNKISGSKITDMSITSEKLSGNIGSDKLSLTDGSIPYAKLNLTNAIQSSDLAPGAVTFSASDLADNSVGQEKLAGSIGYDKLSIADNKISGSKITDMSITSEKLSGNIGSDKLSLTDGSIPYAKLNLTNAIQSSDLAPGAVTVSASDLADGSVGQEKLAGSIGYNKLSIADNEIPGSKITDMSIDPEKLSGNIGSEKLSLAYGSIPYTTLYLTGAIQSSDLAPGAVTVSASDLADGSVGQEKLAGSIGYDKLSIADNEIPGSKITDMSIATEKLSGNITSDKLSLTDGSIPYAKLDLTNAIQSSDLAPGAVTVSASDLADGSVGQEKLAGSIGYNKLSIADNEIPGSKITDMSIDPEKLSGNIGSEKLSLTYGTIPYTTLYLSGAIQASDLAPGVLSNTITTEDIEDGAITYPKLKLAYNDIPYTALYLNGLIQASDIAPGVLGNTGDIEDGAITYQKLSLANNDIPYTALNIANSIQGSDISDGVITYPKLNLASNDIPYTALSLNGLIQASDLAPGVLGTTVTTGEIEDGEVTF
ncbi:conserved hypothetical protein, secreted, partial [Candidatus Magnetomorum sp. HK-1]